MINNHSCIRSSIAKRFVFPMPQVCLFLAVMAIGLVPIGRAQEISNVEVSGFSGVNRNSIGTNSLFGGTVGSNLSSSAQVFFVPSYASTGSFGHELNFDGGLKVAFPSMDRKIAPFVDGVFGYSRYTYASTAVFSELTRLVVLIFPAPMKRDPRCRRRCAIAGGSNWGLEPKFRWQRDRVLQ